MNRWLLMIPLMVFALLILWLAAGLRRDPQTLPSELINHTVSEFSLRGLNEEAVEARLTEADLQSGKPILVNFFASWCLPCREEAPLLKQLQKQGVIIIGIGYKDRPEAVHKFLSELGNPFAKIGLDLDGRMAIDFGVYGIPETFIIDGAGVIRYRHAGVLTEELFKNRLQPILTQLAKKQP
ncbi:MAG: DsbE family thiol:disulfide interchange protein [Candidatus Pacebacteria bacterium]|nr:DsbE family thiol:disulfide interchange protein [Candidatus Paceibacterota bacterium]